MSNFLIAGPGDAEIKCISLSGRSHFEFKTENIKSNSSTASFNIDSVTHDYGSNDLTFIIIDPSHRVLTISQADSIDGKFCSYKFYAIPASWDSKVDKAHRLDTEFKAVLRGNDPREPIKISPIIDMTCSLKWNI